MSLTSGPPTKACCWPILTINSNRGLDAGLSFVNGEQARMYVSSPGGDCSDINLKTRADAPGLKDGKWHHFAGGFVNNHVTLHYDGKQIMDLVCGGKPLTLKSEPISVGVGIGDYSPSGSFAGNLDEVRM